MISQERTVRKKIQKFVDAAEKLAALQFQAGLYSGKPSEIKLKPKVDKAWQEFNLAADTILKQPFIILQENNIAIGLDVEQKDDE